MKKCVVMGNGPSLSTVDIEQLKSANIDTFGLNRAFLAYEDWDFFPTYYGMFDDKRVHQCVDGVDMLMERPTKHIFLRPNEHILKEYGSVEKITMCIKPKLKWMEHAKHFGAHSIDSFNNRMEEFPDPVGSSTITAIQLLYGMGYTHVALVGVDANYVDEKKQKNAQNHFIKGYILDMPSQSERGNDTKRWKFVSKSLATSKKMKLYSCSKKSKINGIIEYKDLNEFYRL